MNVPRALPLALLLAYAAPSALPAQDDRPRPESVQEKTELLNAEISKLRTRLARSGRARAGDRRGDPQDQARRFAAKDLPRRYRPGVCCRSVSTGGGAAGAA
jgi:hypothetical protein